MPVTKTDTKPKGKEYEHLIAKFIKLKYLLTHTSGKPNSILNGKIPDIKEIYRRLQKKQY